MGSGETVIENVQKMQNSEASADSVKAVDTPVLTQSSKQQTTKTTFAKLQETDVTNPIDQKTAVIEIAKMKLLSPFQLTKQIKLQNRGVKAAIGIGCCENGIPSQETIDYYKRAASGKPAMVIVERSFPSERGRTGLKGQLGIQDDSMVQHHHKIVQAIKGDDPRVMACLQISHSGCIGYGPDPLFIDSASVEELEDVVLQFEKASFRAKKAGYDCIELQAAHGFLLVQSLSFASNKRKDDYAFDKLKLITDCLKASKKAGIPVGVKVNTDDFM